jgi:hypothetical protein
MTPTEALSVLFEVSNSFRGSEAEWDTIKKARSVLVEVVNQHTENSKQVETKKD